MTEITVEVILTAERRYRQGALSQYEWRVRRKAELEEQERKRKIEAERAEKERQRRIEQARINRLLRDASAFQQARTIRQYVETIRSALMRDTPLESQEFENWSRWALEQADRIDPVIAGRFLKAMQDERWQKAFGDRTCCRDLGPAKCDSHTWRYRHRLSNPRRSFTS